MARSAIMDHVTKIRMHLSGDGACHEMRTMKEMIDAELSCHTVKEIYSDHNSVFHQLVSLTRAIKFLVGIVKKLQADATKEMCEAIRESYATSLRSHHDFVVRNTVMLAARAAPSRTKFVERLDENDSDALRTIDEMISTVHSMNDAYATLTEAIPL